MTRDNRVKPCRYCRSQWGITHLTRSDAQCDLHHSVGLCAVHGGIDCNGTRDGCPGSYAARIRQPLSKEQP
jgi:hypothetical protein